MNIEARVEKIRDVLGDTVIAGTFRKLAQIELEKCKRLQGRLKSELKPYEDRFKMTSEKAWMAYQEGKIGDEADIMEWMMVYKNFLALEARSKKIRDIDLT